MTKLCQDIAFDFAKVFPIAGAKDGWSKLARNLKAEIDEEKIEAFKGAVSLPFERGTTPKSP